jgi:long-subunit fatty acid transport protein
LILKKLLFSLGFAFCFSSIQAQVEWESQLWTSAEIEYDFKGPWSISLSPEFRYRLQPFMLRTIFPDVALTYKFNKQFSAALHYRYQYTNEGMGNHYIVKNFLLDMMYRRKVGNWQYGLRLRGGTIEDGNPDPELLQWQSWEVREKFAVSYELNKKYELYTTIEFFQLPVEDLFYNQQTRVSAGFEYSLNKSQKLQLGLLFQNRPDIKRLNPVCAYSLSLDELLKKKKKK